MIPRLRIDSVRCGATGLCVYWAANTFDIDDRGVAFVKDAAGDSPDVIRIAVENCPMRAISFTTERDHAE